MGTAQGLTLLPTPRPPAWKMMVAPAPEEGPLRVFFLSPCPARFHVRLCRRDTPTCHQALPVASVSQCSPAPCCLL